MTLHKHALARRWTAAALAGTMMLGLMPHTWAQQPREEEAPPIPVAADWKFQQSYTQGSIAGGDLVVLDQSGNGNDLVMQTYGTGSWEDYLSFTQDSMTGTDGSLLFDGNSSGKVGADFITRQDAPINSEEFEEGYTLEFIYQLPMDWTAADQWMSILARQGSGGGNPEGEQGTMYASVSNCKEIQFITGNADGDHSMSSAAWSVSMDKGGVWYHIAIVSDGAEISTYVNGCEAFRDYVSPDMVGMYADPADGRFRVGSSWWDGLDKFLQGSLQQVRLTAAPLDKDQWLVENPEDYVGEMGSNQAYQLRDEDNYNIVLIPDTQNTVEYRPDVMDTAVDKLIASVDALNIAGVVHLGDVVDDAGDATQYDNAKDIFYQLPQAGVKFLIQPGNHDNWNGSGSSYWHYFGADSQAYMDLTSSYLTTKAWSGAMFVEAGSYTYMIISLASEGGKTSWNPTSGEVEWLEEMLQKYPNCPTIVTRHDIQNCSDTQPSAVKLSPEGQKLWEIVKKYPQVFMMVGGHSHGSGVEVLQNDAGQDVISMLTDLQFSYNGGNGWFRYLEFDESADKIYYSTYSPYAASLSEEEKSFFDVNFLTGDGHEGELDLDFETRFAGMAHEPQQPQTEGAWMTGEYHNHTLQSNDASESYMTLENTLDVAFREDLDDLLGTAAQVDNIQYGQAFDFMMVADHLRNSPRNPDGTANLTARWSAIGAQLREIEKLQAQGKYEDKLISAGFEWDMMALDHASVALLDQSGNVPMEGLRAFEWLFSYDTTADQFFNNEEEEFGPRQNDKNDVTDTYAAVEWVAENYPDSFILPNHPSRHNDGDSVVDLGEVTVEHLRTMNDIAPDVVFGFEGMPGNQLDPACELPMDDLRAGADEMISVTGGVWDALLSEGRRFYNFANSDFHFKISSSEQYSSGYWPGEFSRNWTFVEPGDNGLFDFADVVEGLRSGNSYAVNGELITDLTFTVSHAANSAGMGQDLNVVEGDQVTVTIRFQVPEHNNYTSLYGTDTGIEVDNTPEVDHVDLIMGHVTGKVDEADYGSTANTDAAIVRTFSKEELAAAKGEDGYYTLTYTTVADGDLYFRVRGLSNAAVDENGDPLTHEREVTDVRPARFDYINDYNYANLSFYANPVWVNVADTQEIAELEITQMPTRTQYTVGETFDPTGMVVTAVYENGATAPVTGYTVTPGGALTVQDTHVTVTYAGRSVTVPITVTDQTTPTPSPVPSPQPSTPPASGGSGETQTGVTITQDASHTLTVDGTAITLGNASQVFALGTLLSVDRITSGTIYETVKQALAGVVESMDHTAIFEFNATLGGAQVQPDGTLSVTFAIPQHLSATNLRLYYVSQEGKYQEVPITVDPNTKTVTANLQHFSTYVLANVAPASGGSDTNPDTGDHTPLAAYVWAAMSSLVLLGGVVALHHRRRRI